MKIDRHTCESRTLLLSGDWAIREWAIWGWLVLCCLGLFVSPRVSLAQYPPSFTRDVQQVPQATPAIVSEIHSSTTAVELVERVIASLAQGPAFDAKVRQRVWTSGREMVGVGTYEQAGDSSGQFNLQLTMHDGDGKHTLQQISDGRLAWTRTEIAANISLKRVDVGRLGEWASMSQFTNDVSPRLRVGAWTELLDTIRRDYILRLTAGRLEAQAVWIVTGKLRESVREDVLRTTRRSEWPALYPSQVQLAIAATPAKGTNFGEGLPIRIEYRTDGRLPTAANSDDEPSTAPPLARLIMLVELYSIRPIDPPPLARFRYESQDVNFVNETDRYLKLYGIQLSDSDRKRMRR